MDVVKEFGSRFGDKGKLPSVAVELSDGRSAFVGNNPYFIEFSSLEAGGENAVAKRYISLNAENVVKAAGECMRKKTLFLFEGRHYFVKDLKALGAGKSARIQATLEAAGFVDI